LEDNIELGFRRISSDMNWIQVLKTTFAVTISFCFMFILRRTVCYCYNRERFKYR